MSTPDSAPGPTQPRAPTQTPGTAAINARFAAVEQWGTRITLTLVIVAYALYLGGILPPFVPVERLPTVVGAGVESYVARSGVPTGWGWLAHLERGDMLSHGALVALVSVIIAAYAGLVPVLLRHGERLYLALVLLQLAVFLLAGSGVLGGGGH